MNYTKLRRKSDDIRKATIKLCVESGEGLFASSSSCIELMVCCYYSELFDFIKRDHFILSKGHATASYYNILADQGYFPKRELKNYCKKGMLQLHPHIDIPGVEFNTGSLGHGLPFGAGLALGMKMKQDSGRVIVLMGDAECQEGTTWEAALFASQHKLNNLIVIIDKNQKGCLGKLEDSMSMKSVTDKWNAFHWNEYLCDGHDVADITSKLELITDSKHWANGPLVLVAYTIKGKGVKRIEDCDNNHLMKVGRDDL